MSPRYDSLRRVEFFPHRKRGERGRSAWDICSFVYIYSSPSRVSDIYKRFKLTLTPLFHLWTMKMSDSLDSVISLLFTSCIKSCITSCNWTMQNRFLNLDNFFICLAYDDLMVGISDGTNCF